MNGERVAECGWRGEQPLLEQLQGEVQSGTARLVVGFLASTGRILFEEAVGLALVWRVHHLDGLDLAALESFCPIRERWEL